MNLQTDKTPFIAKSHSCLRMVERSRKYQIILTVIILLLVLFQLFFGFYSVPAFFNKQSIFENYKFEINIPWKQLPEFLSLGKKAEDNQYVKSQTANAQPKKYKLTACAMMHNEAPYLIEWIEFHRLQGVDHFVLYNYFGTDLIEYTPMLYENTNIRDLVEVMPARFFGQDPKRIKDLPDYLQNKEWSFVDCYVRSGKQSEWLLLLDVGHFVYSQEYETIPAFISDQQEKQKPREDDFPGEFKHSEPFSAVRIPTVRYGTSGQISKFKTWLSPNSYTGSVDLLYEPYNNTGNIYPMVMETNLRRAPHRELDGNYTDLPVCEDSAENGSSLGLCSESSSVTLVRADRFCVKENMTECLQPIYHFIWPELPVMRADNHDWRSLEHVQKSVYSNFQMNKTFDALDLSWFSSVVDDYKKHTFAGAVRKRIMDVKPRLFLDIGRVCRADAILNGQQLMCPETHPFPFGNLGVKYLRDCCHKDKDAYGNQMWTDSPSCDNNTSMECTEPEGLQKWLHRSCCIYDSAFAHLKMSIGVPPPTPAPGR